MKAVLAFDLAAWVGWAGRDATGLIQSGSVKLQTASKTETRGDRFARFNALLDNLFSVIKPELVAYEEVMAHSSVASAHAFGGYRSILEARCAAAGIRCEGIGVTTVKKFATGRGVAPKSLMIMAARAKWPDQDVKDDNHADALWVLQTAIHTLTK